MKKQQNDDGYNEIEASAQAVISQHISFIVTYCYCSAEVDVRFIRAKQNKIHPPPDDVNVLSRHSNRYIKPDFMRRTSAFQNDWRTWDCLDNHTETPAHFFPVLLTCLLLQVLHQHIHWWAGLFLQQWRLPVQTAAWCHLLHQWERLGGGQ